jgi:hypothetical protein
MTDPASIEGLLRELGLRANIEVVHNAGDMPDGAAERAAVFVANKADRDIYLKQGYPQNLVFCEEDLIEPLAM